MGIDIVDVLGLDAGVLDGTLHHELGTESLGMAGSDVISVGTHAATDDFTVNLGATGQRMLEFLEHEAHTAFTHDESVA